MRCYLFDIDGTLADCQHRIHHIDGDKKDWRAFFAACDQDSPIEHVLGLAQHLALSDDHTLVFVSGRSDECRAETVEWLHNNGLDPTNLYMRKAGDHRPDDIIKLELLAQLRSHGFEPIMAFDDRDRVVAAWRGAGVPCAQVAPGNF